MCDIVELSEKSFCCIYCHLFLCVHVRATVNANIKYDRVTLKQLRESTQNLLFHLSMLDSFPELFRDDGATPGQA